jgi:RHS repeat-associated protein
VPFNGGILAEYYGGSPAGTIFDHPDEIGSATTSSDYTGQTINEKLFYPFGELWTGAAIPNLNMHQTFAQLPDYDAETDQYNTLARHYTPMGRWMSPDPGGLKVVRLDDPQTWNMYAYVRNNPTTLTDPSGLVVAPFNPVAQCDPMLCAQDSSDASYPAPPPEQDPPAAEKPPQPSQSPDPNLPVNNDYRMVVINDTGGNKEDLDKGWNTRDVNYSLHTAPDANNLTGKPVQGDDIVTTEHMNNQYFTPSSDKSVFQDRIGPRGALGHADESTDRYFTAKINGKELGVIPILDRFGTHLVDHIVVEFQNDRAKLNGTYAPTDVQ